MKKERSYYESPATSEIDLLAEELICLSNYMQFGTDNSSGNIDDDDVIYGGDF